MAKGVQINADGTLKIVTIDQGPDADTLKQMQECVGGLVEIIGLGNGAVMLVNEEGMLLNLPINRAATEYSTSNTEHGGFLIFGDAVVLGDNLDDAGFPVEYEEFADGPADLLAQAEAAAAAVEALS